MKVINVLIVEDDPIYSVELERIVQESGYHVLEVVDNSETALRVVQTEIVHLILMDISIKGRLNGIEVAEQLAPLGIPIIFLTVFEDDQTYMQVKQLGAYRYIVKPVKKLTLQNAIESVLVGTKEPSVKMEMLRLWQEDTALRNHIFLKTGNRLMKIDLTKVAIIESDGNYVTLYTENGKYAAKMSLKRIKQKISSRQYVQIHRNYIVNILYINTIDNKLNQVDVLGKGLPLGVTYKTQFMERLNSLGE